MKRNQITKPILALFITGLLLTSLMPIVSRYFHMPDAVKGFLMGMGLMLEVIAIIKMTRNRKKINCV